MLGRFRKTSLHSGDPSGGAVGTRETQISQIDAEGFGEVFEVME